MIDLFSNPIFAGCGTVVLLLLLLFIGARVWHAASIRLDHARGARQAIETAAMQHLGTLDLPFYVVWCSKDAGVVELVVDVPDDLLGTVQSSVIEHLRAAGFGCEVQARTFADELANPSQHIHAILTIHRVTTCPHGEKLADPGEGAPN